MENFLSKADYIEKYKNLSLEKKIEFIVNNKNSFKETIHLFPFICMEVDVFSDCLFKILEIKNEANETFFKTYEEIENLEVENSFRKEMSLIDFLNHETIVLKNKGTSYQLFEKVFLEDLSMDDIIDFIKNERSVIAKIIKFYLEKNIAIIKLNYID